MTLAWIGAQFSPQAPGFWLLVSVLLTSLLLSIKESVPARGRQPLWLAHWLLVPYLGLLFGGLSPRLMGLTGIDWLASLGLGLGLVFGIVVLLVLVRAAVDLDPAHSLTPPRIQAAAPGPDGWRALGNALVWCGAAELHWAFLRGAVEEILTLRPAPLELPAYWAVWCAALIASLEILATRPRFAPWLLQMTTLVTTSILFFYTRNFWLCWVLHTAVQLIGHSSPVTGGWPRMTADR